METLLFEWDENKNEVNKKKHGLSFETAQEVFYDDAAILFDDPEHSIGEERFLIIGMIKTSKICIVKLSILLDNFFSKIFEIFLNVKLW